MLGERSQGPPGDHFHPTSISTKSREIVMDRERTRLRVIFMGALVFSSWKKVRKMSSAPSREIEAMRRLIDTEMYSDTDIQDERECGYL